MEVSEFKDCVGWPLVIGGRVRYQHPAMQHSRFARVVSVEVHPKHGTLVHGRDVASGGAVTLDVTTSGVTVVREKVDTRRIEARREEKRWTKSRRRRRLN